MGNKQFIDITMPLHERTEKPSPSLEGFRLKWDLRIDMGQGRNRSNFSMGSHIGTHVDAPVHFIQGGKSIDEIVTENLLGIAEVIHVPYPEAVTDDLLEKQYHGADIVLFKYGRERLDRKWPYFKRDGVEYLITRGVRVVGTDNFNIDSIGTEWEIHHLILGKEILVIEGLDLNGVAAGIYEFICLPLRIIGAEAAPARAFLIQSS